MPVPAPWTAVSRALGVRPLVSASLGRRHPIRVERYVFQARQQQMPALATAVIVVHLGGARVVGGQTQNRPSHYLPSFALFLAPGSPSQWLFDGPVDVAGFYLPAELGGRLCRTLAASPNHGTTYGFADPLVTATAREIVEELRNTSSTDQRFNESLLRVLIHQTERILAGRTGARFFTTPSQLTRVKSTLGWIDANLHGRLDNVALARHVGLGESHFRHAFTKAVGMTPQIYVRQRRLERARELLAVTGRPIAQIADDCGFASQSHLTTCFRERHGVTPAKFRRALQQGTLA